MAKRIDIFPAVIKLAPAGSLEDFSTLETTGPAPEGTRKLDRCRAVVLNDILMIALDSPTGPELVFKELIIEDSHEGKTSHLLTKSGKIIAVTKDENCGCGSRLRSWSPYGGIAMSTSDPTE